jgi:integrase/recombinase XerD
LREDAVAKGALIARNKSGHNVLALKKQALHDLVALATLYYTTQVAGQANATEEAKRRDIERFLTFYFDLFHHYHPRDWHSAVTRSFLKSMQGDKRLAQATVCRVYASVRHFARWAHKTLNPFPFGCPTDGVPPPEEPEGDWKGLTRQNALRLLSAARALQVQKGRGINQGVRDHAAIAALLGTGLRVSELLGLDLDQWDESAFIRVRIKSNRRLKTVPITAEGRKAVVEWLKERGDTPGPIFLTARRRRLGRKQLYEILKRVERQANAQLPAKQQFTVTPHVLRHTFLRKLAETKGVQYAKEASGHKTDRYIWRYVKPDQETLAEAIDKLE